VVELTTVGFSLGGIARQMNKGNVDGM